MTSQPTKGEDLSNSEAETTATTTKSIIIALSGPSSSGKTTLARLLRSIFNTTASNLTLKLSILHQDDFYKSDTAIPKKTFYSHQHGTRLLDDWDCIDALDLPLFESTLQHIKLHGTLPDDAFSKEDQNSVGTSPVSPTTLASLTTQIRAWADTLPVPRPASTTLTTSTTTTTSTTQSASDPGIISIWLLDGFLLFPSPSLAPIDPRANLRRMLDATLAARLFIPCTRTTTVERRTRRTGYVTLEGFWQDPPGYVEDVVWPNYAADHAWLFGADSSELDELRRRIDEGEVARHVAERHGILVGPGRGDTELDEVLTWACRRVQDVVEAALA